MKKWFFAVLILFVFGCLGIACKGSSSPTSSNGTPVPTNGGGGGY